MAEISGKINNLLSSATEEYRRLNEINIKTLNKLGVSVDDFDPETLGILKRAVSYLRKCDAEELSKEKFQIWYMQKCLENSELHTQIFDLNKENRKVIKEIKEETEICDKMTKNIEELEKTLNINCSESRAKEIMQKNESTIEMYKEKLKDKLVINNPELQRSNLEKRIEDLENLRKTLEQKTRIAENKKILDSIKEIVKK